MGVLSFEEGEVELFGQAGELGQRRNFHLFHHPGAVNLDRLFGRPQLRGDLFIEPTGDDVRQDFAFPRRERLEAAPDFSHFGLFLPYPPVPLERPVDDVEVIYPFVFSSGKEPKNVEIVPRRIGEK